MKWTLLLERRTENALNSDIARKHLRYIAASAERNKSFGFTGRAGKLGEPETVFDGIVENKRYLVRIRLEEDKARTAEIALERFQHIKGVVEKAAQAKGWTLIGEKVGTKVEAEETGVGVLLGTAKAEARTPFAPIDLTDDIIAAAFGDVYDREAHLRIINDAVQTHVQTNGDIRAHTILYGEPGGCKSSLLERLKTLYDDDLERVVFLDAPTMTKAGLERWILEKATNGELPEVIVMEEIEKCDKDNLLALGSIMASGYIMRTNANIGRVQEPAKFLLLATCNDEQAVREFRRGFIWDRFTNQLACTLPDEATMHRILVDKIAGIPGGKESWADKAMTLARTMKIRSPRKIIGFLAGRHRLETGAYQRDLMKITVAGQREKETLAKP